MITKRKNAIAHKNKERRRKNKQEKKRTKLKCIENILLAAIKYYE